MKWNKLPSGARSRKSSGRDHTRCYYCAQSKIKCTPLSYNYPTERCSNCTKHDRPCSERRKTEDHDRYGPDGPDEVLLDEERMSISSSRPDPAALPEPGANGTSAPREQLSNDTIGGPSTAISALHAVHAPGHGHRPWQLQQDSGTETSFAPPRTLPFTSVRLDKEGENEDL